VEVDKMTRAIPLLAVLALAGCSSGFNRSAAEARLQMEDLQVTSDDVVKAESLRPQLAFPCRIAVKLKGEQDSHWTGEDKKSMECWAATLRQEGIASDVFFINDLFTPQSTGNDLKGLRATAAQYGADALFVMCGTAKTHTHRNPASILNLTIVGGYLAPGSTCDALFTIQAGLVDVHNGMLYATVESEGESTIYRPTWVLEEKDAIEKAKGKALAAFGPEVLQRMRNVKDAFAPVVQ
jgi:hypothetical protein